MTGRYLIYTPPDSIPDERRFDAAWRRFAEVCRSLNRDGLDYSVRLNLADARPHVLVTASGKARPRKQVGAHRVPLPPPIPAQRCRDRAVEVEWFLPENRERRKDGKSYWGKHQARYQELSAIAEEHIRAELEYRRELELLSGQRARFKPGSDGRNGIRRRRGGGMTSPMLTLVSADCVQCGATRETVRQDRELQADAGAVCCEIAELIELDPREPYAEDDYCETLEPEVACYYCGNLTRSPLGSGKRAFCSKACWSDYAE